MNLKICFSDAANVNDTRRLRSAPPLFKCYFLNKILTIPLFTFNVNLLDFTESGTQCVRVPKNQQGK